MYKKISKQEARRLYESHKDFVMTPSKMCPHSFMAAIIDGTSFERVAEIDFDTMVNYFQYYNCNSETGRRVAFWKAA